MADVGVLQRVHGHDVEPSAARLRSLFVHVLEALRQVRAQPHQCQPRVSIGLLHECAGCQRGCEGAFAREHDPIHLDTATLASPQFGQQSAGDADAQGDDVRVEIGERDGHKVKHDPMVQGHGQLHLDSLLETIPHPILAKWATSRCDHGHHLEPIEGYPALSQLCLERCVQRFELGRRGFCWVGSGRVGSRRGRDTGRSKW
mmetsp:Transcript_36239/g.62749  ORF Transcript_36239/g.62749 Transcript_36239/m.62749 type:complete len:202 (-) Transcript_36239:500-1105(-)